MSLTTGVDSLVGTSNNDVFNATDASFTLSDSINGGAGVDTLNYVSATAIAAAAPVGATVTGIETYNITSGAGVTADTTTGFVGLTALNSTGKSSAASTKLTAAATTNIGATEGDLQPSGTSQLVINGGKDVTVTAAGTTTNGTALTATDGTGAEILVGATTAAAGAVTVNSTFKGTNNQVAGDIFVKGGTTVTINQSTTNTTTNETNVQGAVGVVGTAATTAVTVTQNATAAASNTGLGRVGKTAGAVTINDVNAASTTAAGSIATVSLTNAGAAAINSSALTTLNLAGTLDDVNAGTLGALTTPTVKTLALNLTGATEAAGKAVTISNNITTLNISGNTTASTLTSLVAGGATTINVSGDAKVTLSGNTTGAVTAINVTNTKGASFGTAIGAAVSFAGGAGDDAVTLSNSFTKAITMGAGSDKVTVAAGNTTIGTGGSVDAGDGTDTIVLATADALTFAGDSTFNSKFKNFEALELSSANTSNDVLDLDGINAVTSVKLTAAVTGNFTLNNVANGGTVTLTTDGANTPALTVGVRGALVGASDVLNLSLNKSTVLATGTVKAANVETVNILTADAATAGSAAVVHTLTLQATSATSVTVAGNNGLNLTNTNNSKITNFDASGIVANDTAAAAGVAATADTGDNLAVTFASANTTATANVTIKGGAGNDSLTGSVAIDSISGGAGNDAIYADNAGTKEVQTLKVKTADGTPNGKTIALVIDGLTVTTTLATADNDATKQAAAIVAAINGDATVGKLVTAAATANAGEFTLTYKVDGDQVAPTVSGTSGAVLTGAAGDTTVSAGGSARSNETTPGTAGTVASDTVDGGAGADVIAGGGGADTITTGAGADTVFFLKAQSNLATMATITDFTYAVGGSSNDKIVIGDVIAAASNKTTVQDLSTSATLAAALDAAALGATTDLGLSVFIWGGNEYVYVETTGATTTYQAGDFVVKLTGLPLAAGTALAGAGFDAV